MCSHIHMIIDPSDIRVRYRRQQHQVHVSLYDTNPDTGGIQIRTQEGVILETHKHR